MIIQLVCGLFSSVSITFLKDTYRPFAHAIHLDELISALFIPPVDGFPAKLSPL